VRVGDRSIVLLLLKTSKRIFSLDAEVALLNLFFLKIDDRWDESLPNEEYH
jgi:hypothetical protein